MSFPRRLAPRERPLATAASTLIDDRLHSRPLRHLLTAAALASALLGARAGATERLPDAAAASAGSAVALQRAIDEIVARTPLRAAHASVLVASLESGQVLYARDPDALLNPASNVKLFTSAAALARLGPEYRFETEAWAEPAPPGGAVRTLYVRGKGDPTFVTERLWGFAGEIAHRVKRIQGDVVIDDGFFDGEREGPGYDQERGDRSYLAPVGAVSLNFNVIAIHVSPGARPGDRGQVEVEPASEFVQVENRTRTVRSSARRRVAPASMALPGGRQRIVVEGRIPAGSREGVFYRKIDDPAAYFGFTLKRLLELRGVRVGGQVRRGAVPADARRVLTVESEALGEIVRKLDKTSNNFIAEQLLKTLGAEKRGAPGTWPKGVAAVEEFLAEAGIPRGSYVMKNGSGLNDTNRFSARQTVALLREMWRRFPLMADFLAALPVAGRDGTTRWRMDGTEGRLRAKTGTLEGVTSLSGYVETASGERLVFSILVNDFPGRSHLVVRAVDAVGTALAAAGRPADLGAAVASATPPASQESDAADLRAHLATYYQLARAGERGNVAFLRTALRSEADPVLRLAAAEALYLSDPDAQAARRTFLDEVASDGGSYPRLRALAADLAGPQPVIGSLADLAADRNGDALARLVELAPAALADPTSGDAVAELWGDVARNLPDDLVRTLAAATPAAADAAVAAVARGAIRGEEGEHPFPAAVQRAAADADPDLARYARLLGPKLEAQMAAARAVQQAAPPRMGPAPSPSSAAPAEPPRAPAAAGGSAPARKKTEG